MTTRVALFPGTFDPPTLGHLDVVRRAARLFDSVVVAVAAHHDKRHLLSLDERLECVRSAVADLPGVEVLALDGLLVEGARRLGACAVVRGVRTAADLEYERQMALTNRALHPDLETVLVLPSPEVSHISSTLVRQVALMGAPLEAFLTPEVERIVRAALNR
ncbi:MAG: pantetheine-phosphate adenylyltransferase [Planctomycetes bacterium]|nr:pantetheine-phosphate adenylyltransferase [Planctomycetota bacterium]